MSYRVTILARARQDLDEVVAWVAERSPEGAERLIDRFEATLARIEQNPFATSIASESRALGEEVRHAMFRTRSGRTYRALFVVVGDEVRILRVRGSGQPPVRRDDLDI